MVIRGEANAFVCEWYLESLHNEAVHSISMSGLLMVTCVDDGHVVLLDLSQILTSKHDEHNKMDISSMTMSKLLRKYMVEE